MEDDDEEDEEEALFFTMSPVYGFTSTRPAPFAEHSTVAMVEKCGGRSLLKNGSLRDIYVSFFCSAAVLLSICRFPLLWSA